MSYSCSDRLKKCRLQAEMTQSELAEKCGYTERTIGNYEQGSRVPDNQTVVEMAKALKVSPLALAEPILDDAAGILHTLIRIMDKYDLSISVSENKVTLDFHNTEDADAMALLEYLRDLTTVTRYRDRSQIEPAEFEKWICKYPDYAELAYGEQLKYSGTIIKDTSCTVLDHQAKHYYKRK